MEKSPGFVVSSNVSTKLDKQNEERTSSVDATVDQSSYQHGFKLVVLLFGDALAVLSCEISLYQRHSFEAKIMLRLPWT